MVMIFGPIARIESRSDSSKPRIIAVIPTIDVMPITTPSTVNPERILLLRTVSSAIVMTSPTSPMRIAISASFLPQRFDRIEPRGARRRIQAKEETDQGRHPDAQGDRPDFDRRRHRGEGGDRQRDPG